MKKSNRIKKIMAILLCVALLVCSFTACSSSKNESDVTSSAAGSSQSAQGNNGGTDGKTDGKEDGKKDDKQKDGKTDGDGKTDKNGKTSNPSDKTIKKPSKPSEVSSLKASKITSSSVTLSWKKVKCNGYRVRVFNASGDKVQDITCKSSTYKVSKLDSYTDYEFRVRAYNENEAGKSESKDASVTASTKAADSQRKIKISVRLPENSARTDTLNVYIIDGKKEIKIKTAKIKCDGSTYTFTTDKKYKGIVTIKAELVDNKASDTVKTDKKAVTLNLTKIGIVQIDGDDD